MYTVFSIIEPVLNFNKFFLMERNKKPRLALGSWNPYFLLVLLLQDDVLHIYVLYVHLFTSQAFLFKLNCDVALSCDAVMVREQNET